MVGKPIGVELGSDRRILGSLLFVLVENPFQSRAVTKLVRPCFGRDTRQLSLGVQHDDASFWICLERWLGRQAGVFRFFVHDFNALQLPWSHRFVSNME